MATEQKKIAELDEVYLYLNRQAGVGGEYYPFLYEAEGEKILSVFTSKNEADKAAEQMRSYMELPEEEKLYIGKIGKKEALAIYLEYCLHGGKIIHVDIAGESQECDCIDVLNGVYEQLGHQPLFNEENRGFPAVMRELYVEECSFYTLPRATTNGEQIMDNQFLTIHQGDGVLFFADEESAVAYYEAEDLPAEWNLESDFKQVVQLLLYSFDRNMKQLIICREEQRTVIELQLAFWLIQRMARRETYLLIPVAYER